VLCKFLTTPSAGCTASNGSVTAEQLSGVDLKGSSTGLFETLSLFCQAEPNITTKNVERDSVSVDRTVAEYKASGNAALT
jgi:hypothetical protein